MQEKLCLFNYSILYIMLLIANTSFQANIRKNIYIIHLLPREYTFIQEILSWDVEGSLLCAECTDWKGMLHEISTITACIMEGCERMQEKQRLRRKEVKFERTSLARRWAQRCWAEVGVVLFVSRTWPNNTIQ